MSDVAPEVAETSIDQLQRHGPRLQLLANQFVVGLATAEVLAAGEVDVLRAIPGTVPSDMVAALDQRITEAINEANASYFRFDIRTADQLAEGSPVELVDGDTLVSGLGDDPTRKLTVLVALTASGPEGTAVLQVPAFGKERPLRPGTVYLFPAFVAPTFTLPEGASLTGVVLHAYGPSFR